MIIGKSKRFKNLNVEILMKCGGCGQTSNTVGQSFSLIYFSPHTGKKIYFKFSYRNKCSFSFCIISLRSHIKFVVSYFRNTHPRFLCRNAGSFYFQFQPHQRIQKPKDLQVLQRDRHQKLRKLSRKISPKKL